MLFDLFKRKKAENQVKQNADSDEKPDPYNFCASKLVPFPFSNGEVCFKKTMIYNVNGIFSLNAKHRTNLMSVVGNTRNLAFHGYSFHEKRNHLRWIRSLIDHNP